MKKALLFLLRLIFRILLISIWAVLHITELVFGTLSKWLKEIISKPL